MSPVLDGGVGIRDVLRVRVEAVRDEAVLDVDEELDPVDFSVTTELDFVSFVADDEDALRSGLDGVGGAFGVSDGASDVSSSSSGSSGFWVSSSS